MRTTAQSANPDTTCGSSSINDGPNSSSNWARMDACGRRFEEEDETKQQQQQSNPVMTDQGISPRCHLSCSSVNCAMAVCDRARFPPNSNLLIILSSGVN